MKHPYQYLEATSTHVYSTVKNQLQVFDISTGNLVGHWVDPVNSLDTLKKQHLERLEKLSELEPETTASDDTANEEPESKRLKTDSKSPKIPLPGPGAPPVYNYIRGLKLTNDESHLIGITDSDKSIIVFKLDFANKDNCLKLVKRQAFSKRPCSISIADNNQSAIIGDKFGDVYKISINEESPVAEKELQPILGHVSMLTQVLMTQIDDKQFILTGDRDEHIKVSHYPQTFVIKHWLFGHEEFISSMLVPDFDSKLLITGGGDDSIYIWNWIDNNLVSNLNVRSLVQPFLNETHLPPERFLNESSVKEITVVEMVQLNRKIVVLFENVKCLLSLNIKEDLSLEFDSLLTLDSPLIDIALCGDDTIIGTSEPENGTSPLIHTFKFMPQLCMNDSENIKLIENMAKLNPCNVNSKEDFYPLYTMNSLRKRSEH